MSKKIMKIAAVLLMAVMMAAISVVPSFATLDWDDVSVSGKQTDISATAGEIAGIIIGVVQVIGVAVAVIMLIVLAIKYVSAAPNDKAEIKKHAVVYVVGAVVLFAASGILEIIKQFAGNIHA